MNPTAATQSAVAPVAAGAETIPAGTPWSRLLALEQAPSSRPAVRASKPRLLDAETAQMLAKYNVSTAPTTKDISRSNSRAEMTKENVKN